MHTTSDELQLATMATTALSQILKQGACKMLQEAIEREVEEYIHDHAHLRDPHGRRLVVRNGYLPPRDLQTPLGSVRVHQPRVNDKRVDGQGNRIRFNSHVLPKYLRKTREIEQLVPWLYLKGISTSDFPEALQALGLDGRGLSATSVLRMKEVWRREWEEWSRRSLAGKRYVYFWADGVHFNIRLAEAGEGKACVLVVMGATEDGTKELVAIHDGCRESEASWRELLLDLKERGLDIGPEVAVGDGGLGFWKALPQVYPSARPQRCWVHKMVNVLNHLPESQHSSAKHKLRQIWMADTRAAANQAFDSFLSGYGSRYPKASQCLLKDRDELMAFYDFPAEHWVHLRTTNPIESTFATVRLRTDKTKGNGSRQACLTMVFKLAQSAERHWNRLKNATLLKEVIEGIRFIDGIRAAA